MAIKIEKHEEFVNGKSNGAQYKIESDRGGLFNTLWLKKEELLELKAEINRVLGEK